MSTATRVTHEGAQELSPEVIKMALMCKDKVETTKELLGITNLNKAFQLENGEQVYVVSNQFVSRVHVVGVEGFEIEPTETESVPLSHGTLLPAADFVCGVVSSFWLKDTIDERVNSETNAPDQLDLASAESWGDFSISLRRVPGIGEIPAEETSEETVELEVHEVVELTQTTASLARFTDREAKLKLAIEPDPTFEPASSPPAPVCQHAYIKPSLYTGYMRAVIQLLLGIGFVGPRTYETKWIEEGEDRNYVSIKTENGLPVERVFGLPKEWDEEGFKVQIKYDYRFFTSHGLSWGSKQDNSLAADEEPEKLCYLIQISQSGVHAMLLPLDPLSKLPEGRERYVTLFPELAEQDQWGEGLLDKLGGFPTGESFPRGNDLQAAIKAGEVIELLDSSTMEAFYEGEFVATSLGWVFQPEGGRADNVCIKWTSAPGWKQGWHYSVVYELAPFNPALDEPYPQHAKWLRGSVKRYLIKKAKRLSPEQIAEILAIEGDNPDAVYEERFAYFKNLTVPSPMSGTGSLQPKKHGDLYNPGIAPIKFSEPLFGGGLVSFDFDCARDAKPPEHCDSPIAVIGEKGGGIATINCFYRKYAPPGLLSWDTRGQHQYVGTWEKGYASEGQRELGYFYTSHLDLRKKVDVGNYSNEKTTGTFVGYNYLVKSCAYYSKFFTNYTWVWHSYEWESVKYSGITYRAAIAFPEGERNAYYAVVYEEKEDYETAYGVIGPMRSGDGPIILHSGVYHWIYYWSPACDPGPPYIIHPSKLTCRMQEHKEASTINSWFPDAPAPEWYDYEIKPYKDDDGDCTGTATFISRKYGPVFSGPTWSESTEPKTTIEYKLRIFGDLPISGATLMSDSLSGDVGFVSTPLRDWWFKRAPDLFMNFPKLSVVQSCWGNQIINYDKQMEVPTAESYGTPNNLRSHSTATYVGYIK